MKNFLFVLVISMIYAACDNKPASATDTGDSATAKTAEPALTMPYTASYSSDVSIGRQADVLTTLNSYKAWENGDMAGLGNTLSDSVSMYFSDGSKFEGTRDSAVAMAKKYRDGFSSVKIDIDVWVPVHLNDKNEDAVLVWYKEIDTHKDGKVDSAYFNDINGFKNGKINYMESLIRKLK